MLEHIREKAVNGGERAERWKFVSARIEAEGVICVSFPPNVPVVNST